jgi:hypothetical protein
MPQVKDDELVNVGLMALEDEMRAWKQIAERDGYVRLIRCPPISLDIGPADMPVAPNDTVEMEFVKTQEVWPFLRWRAMQSAVKAIKASQAESA